MPNIFVARDGGGCDGLEPRRGDAMGGVVSDPAALPRRRVDVLWACIRDGTPYPAKQPTPPHSLTAELS
jgi:hypothetical protein